MRIGIDIRALRAVRTGIGRFVVNLLDKLAIRDNENNYVLYFNSMKGGLPDDVAFNSKFEIKCTRIPNRLLNISWAYTPFPPVELLLRDIDVFHSPNFQMPPTRKASRVVTVHDLVFLRYPEMAIPSSLRHYRPRIKYYLNRSDLIIAVSNATASDIVSYLNINENKIEVVHQGTVTISKSSPEEINLMRSKFGIEGDYILFVGCIEPRKNLVRLFKAFEISGLSSHFQLILAGLKGWHTDELFQLRRSLKCSDKIKWLNYVSDSELASLYSAASFFVYPSIYEGFGLPILEAMSAGCPVLTSSVSSMPEVAGDAALYVDPGNVESIAEGLQQLANDTALRTKLSEMGYKRVEMFKWENTADKMIEVYKRAYEIKRF